VLAIFGDVQEAKIVMDREKNESKGYGFVTFLDPSAAARAASCAVLFIDGRRCPCNLASAKPKK
jgi:RNA recognition motif-containing protein